MEIPPALLASLKEVEGFDRESFLAAHMPGDPLVSVRFNPAKTGRALLATEFSYLPIQSPVPWSSHGYYLSERPSFTQDPLFHAGLYYVQEPSSMFVEQVLVQTIDPGKPVRVLDLCAAPGGKSTLIQSLISADSLLVSNEVIRSRASILQENMIKWGASNVIVTNNDPADFSALNNYFDVIVVDAPCSGSGLFRKDPGSLHEWSVENVHHCSLRQQRILADIWPALKNEGVLVYATCSYSPEEDEVISDWLANSFAAEGIRLKIDRSWGIVESFSPQKKIPGYRFFPDKVRGEGFFISCLRKKEGGTFSFPKFKTTPAKPAKNELGLLTPFVQPDHMAFFKHNDNAYAINRLHWNDWQFLRDRFYIKKAGLLLGRMGNEELIPEHELALSTVISPGIISIAANREDALKYLRKEDIPAPVGKKGWTLVQYRGYNLGWIKVLGNRVNNYYPKDWRILKS